MKKVNFKKRVSQLMAGVFGLALMGGVMLSTVKADAQSPQKQEAEEIAECDTCQRNKRQANIPCIRANAQNGGTWSIWIGDRFKCKSDDESDCPGETACSN